MLTTLMMQLLLLPQVLLYVLLLLLLLTAHLNRMACPAPGKALQTLLPLLSLPG
jgi:hypothetical protein